MKKNLMLVKGKKGQVSQKRKRFKGLSQSLLEAYPFLRAVVKRANEWEHRSEPMHFASFLMSVLSVEVISMTMRDPASKKEMKLQEILYQSTALTIAINEHMGRAEL